MGHVYRRELRPDGDDSLAKIARLVAPGSTLLDVGCGPGALAAYLSAAKRCVVDGIEVDAESAALAREHSRDVVIADLERGELGVVASRKYDYIVCADVLEHLRAPEELTARLVPLLAPGGRLLLSIPNVGYVGVIAALLNGEFRYSDEGLLDRTHLRFFTRRSLLEFLGALGLQAMSVDSVRVEVVQSEFARTAMEGFAPALQHQLLAIDDALAYQFIVEAVPAGVAVAETRVPEVPAALTFLSQVYFVAGEGGFREADRVNAIGHLGVDPQRLRFALPKLASPSVRLRIDVADRPGYFRLHELVVRDARGDALWRWDGDCASLVLNGLAPVADAGRGQLLVAPGDDPSIEILLALDGAALAEGGAVEVECGWPMATDSLAVCAQLAAGPLPSLLATLAAVRSGERRMFLAHAAATRACEVLERERVTLDADNRHLRAELQRALEERNAARLAFDQLNNSLTVRMARPAFEVLHQLRRLRGIDP